MTASSQHAVHMYIPAQPAVSVQPAAREHIKSFELLRAYAITAIVSGHFAGLTGLQLDTVFDRTLANLFKGGTHLFVFVSGFFFYYTFYARFNYRRFLTKKFQNVFVPYVILSLPVILVVVQFMPEIFNGNYARQGDSPWDYLVSIAHYLWTGQVLVAYWYIPFVMIVFALSPLHYAFVGLALRWQLPLCAALLVVSLLAHRPLENVNVLHSLVYFTPIYLLGILAAKHRETLYRWFAGRDLWLLALVVLLAWIPALQGHVDSYHKQFFELNGIDWMLAQKVVMCLFLMIWLHRFETFHNRWLKLVADCSFAIFFLHCYLVRGLKEAAPEALAFDSWWVHLLVTLAAVALCTAAALLVKRLFGRRSRFLTGY